MTPIENEYDTRLVTLVGVIISTTQALSINTDRDVETILAESLYLVNKNVHEIGTSVYLETLRRNYPLLEKAIA